MSSWLEDCTKDLEYLDNHGDWERNLEDISISLSLLDNRFKYYVGTKKESILKDHANSLKNTIKFLGKYYFFLTSRELVNRVKHLAADVKHTLLTSTYEEETGVLDIKLAQVYVSLQAKVISFVDSMSSFMFPRKLYNYREPINILLLISLEKIMYCNRECRNDNIHVRFLKFGSSEFSSDVKGQFYILDNLIHILAMNSDCSNDASNHLYVELREFCTLVENYRRGSEALNIYLGISPSAEVICYQAMSIVRSCHMKEADLEEDVRLKLNDILIDVIGQIKMIKYHQGSDEIKLFTIYPRVDFLGFLEFFLQHLQELQGCKQISDIRCQIKDLHNNIHNLVSPPEEASQEKLASKRVWTHIFRSIRSQIKALHRNLPYFWSPSKTSQGRLASECFWTHIVGLAYQAEYVTDLHLIFPDSRCIATLSKIVKQVKKMKEKMHDLPVKRFHVEDVAPTTSRYVHDMSLEVNTVFLGFQEEIDAIRKYILGGEDYLKTISVVGMAGAGKTYLAKYLFNESSFIGHFDKKAWCTVSQSYQLGDLLLTILNQINPLEIDLKKINDQELADMLYRSLKRHRYLVVIDDVWDASLWSYLIQYFPDDKTQSRILITTRDHNVASKTKSEIHRLRALTEEESWELLQKKLTQQESLPENLVKIAKKVAKSCKGLPLSIVIVGGLMHNASRNEEIWNQIAEDVTSTILGDPQGKCEDILELSYYHLPDHLKSCLLYLGVFPEDHEISVTRLVRLWIGEGLVRGDITSDECVEDVGKRYVGDLITRSLVIPIKERTEGGVKIIQLHDLLRDFCLKKAEDDHFFTVLDRRGIFDLSQCPRRLSINRGMEKHLPFSSLNGVRTIISFCRPISRIMKSKHMMLLNVLDMHEVEDLASYVHRFVHLRYLAIWKIDSSNQVLVLSPISKMWKLQILILSSSYYNHVFEVPDFIWDLVKLRHIHLLPSALFPCPDRKRLEGSSYLLENLKSLSKPRLHYGDSTWISKLPKLQKLSCIFFYSLKQYRFPELNLCNQLTSLKVENGAKRREKERGNKLYLPVSLRKLSLSKFILSSDDISEIGKSVPNLEVLKLHDSFEYWSVRDDDFPKLKVLKISGGSCREWEASEESFLNLQQLWLKRCYTLGGIPLSFGDIPCLRLISIKYCNRSVYESAKEIKEMQVEAQNLELKVDIESADAY